MSPAPSVPSSASVSACSPTSASEWPSRRSGQATCTPSRTSPVAGRQPVHVEAEAGAPSPRRPQQPLGAREIRRLGDLQVVLVAGHQRDRQAVRLGQRGVVGQRGAGEAPVRLQDPVVREALRRLRPEQAAAVDGARDRAVVAAFQRVGHRQRRQHRGVRAQTMQHPVDHRRVEQRPDAVVDQHQLRRSRQPGSPGRAVPIPAASRRPAPDRAASGPRPPRHRAPRRRRASPRARHRCRDVGTSAPEQWRSSGLPASGRYCLGRSPPKRAPRPDATTSATHVGKTVTHSERCQAGTLGGAARCLPSQRDLLASRRGTRLKCPSFRHSCWMRKK